MRVFFTGAYRKPRELNWMVGVCILLTTLVLVHFWTLVGNLFTVSQAKRLYGFIGAGSVLGAIAGSGDTRHVQR